MAGQQQAGDRIDEQGTGKALKRRGILAAAGAVVAGIVAKQAVQPVLAANLVLDANQAATGNTNIHGPGDVKPWTSLVTVLPVLSVNNTSSAMDHDGIAAMAPGVALYGESSSSVGVYGAGTAIGGIGVVGDSGPTSAAIGVYGQSSNGFGVYGNTAGTSVVAGVYGTSTGAYGIIGSTTAARRQRATPA